MRSEHRSAFDSEVMRLCAMHGRTASAKLLSTWWEALLDLEWDQFTRGLEAVLRESTTFPRPLDLRRQVLGSSYENEREKARAQELRDLDDEVRAWQKDTARVEADKARFQLIREHAQGAHKQAFQAACDSCQFEREHPAAYRHLKPGMVAADVDWSMPVVGCCEEEPRW